MARELAAAERAAVYGRIGTTTQRFGTLASWLVDVLNYLTGNLDREGGAMFPLAAVGQRNSAGSGPVGKGMRVGRWTSRVSGRPEVIGELPVVGLAEEITTPGEGQVRALVTVAGNPLVSTPDAAALEQAVEALEFMVCVDIYVNETTRHADVVLPAPEPLAKAHYDFALYQLAIRSVANYSPPILPRAEDQPDEWETVLRLAAIVAGQGPDADLERLGRPGPADGRRPRGGAARARGSRVVRPRSSSPSSASAAAPRGCSTSCSGSAPSATASVPTPTASRSTSSRPTRTGSTWGRCDRACRTRCERPRGRSSWRPTRSSPTCRRLEAELGARANGQMVLIGRRQLRSNNSWMHNLPALVKGKDRCTVQIHPGDAERLGLVDGAGARVASSVGELVAPVEVTADIMPGVVSIPHGWGHDAPGVRLGVAAEHAGVNSNLLAPVEVDVPSGNAVLNGIPVDVTAE